MGWDVCGGRFDKNISFHKQIGWSICVWSTGEFRVGGLGSVPIGLGLIDCKGMLGDVFFFFISAHSQYQCDRL